MLEQHTLLLRDAELPRDLRGLLRAEDEMAQQLARHGIVRDEAEARKRKFALLGKVVQQRPGQKEAAVDDLAVKPGEKIRQPQHIGRVHQKSRKEAVVDALGRGDRAEGAQMPREHRLGHGAVIRVRERAEQTADLIEPRVDVDRRDRHERRHVVAVAVCRHTDAAGRELRRTLELRDLRADLDHAADIVRVCADGAGIVPDLEIDRAAAVGQHAGQKRLAGGSRLEQRVLEYIKSFHVVAGPHRGDGLVIFHIRPSLSFRYSHYTSLFPAAQSYKSGAAYVNKR